MVAEKRPYLTTVCPVRHICYASTMNPHLLIIYHTQSGNTGQLARAVLKGASHEADVESRFRTAFESNLDDLLLADCIIFGTPENFGYMSGALKDFFDRTYYPAEPYQINLPYAVFISAGNDGSGAEREVDRIVKGYPLRKVSESLICKGEITSEHLRQAEELGQSMAAGLSIGIF